MEQNLQPTVEELKKDTIYLRYICPDTRPNAGLKRLQFCVELLSRMGKVYFGLSFRRAEDVESLEYWLKTGQIVKIEGDVVLPFEDDVWLDCDGKVYILSGVEPVLGNAKHIAEI